MKLDEHDIDTLASQLKEFRAGAIDAQLDQHIDKCVSQLKCKVFKRRIFWRIREYGWFWRIRHLFN